MTFDRDNPEPLSDGVLDLQVEADEWNEWVNPTADEKMPQEETLASIRQRIHHAAAERGRAFEATASTILAAAMWLPAAAEYAKQVATLDSVVPATDSAADHAIATTAFSLENAPHLPEWIAELIKPDSSTAS